MLLILLDTVLNKLLGASIAQLLVISSILNIRIELFSEFLFNGNVFHRHLNVDDSAKVLENLNEVLILVVNRNVLHNNGPVVEVLVAQLFKTLQLDLAVGNPKVSKLLLYSFNLTGRADSDMSVRNCLTIDGLLEVNFHDLDTLSSADLGDLLG